MDSAAAASYPLLCGQRWVLHARDSEPSFARPVQRVYRLKRPVDTSALLAAWRYVVAAKPSMRLNLVETGEGLAQRFLPLGGDIAGVAVRGRTTKVRRAYVQSLLDEDALRILDLKEEPPCSARIVDVDGERYLSLCVDHLAADEIAADILELELTKAYGRELRGQSHPPAWTEPFLRYLGSEPSRRTQEPSNLAYWTRQLAGAPLATRAGRDLWVPGRITSWRLSASVQHEIERACRAFPCSFFSFLLAAHTELLFRTAETNDLVLNVPVSNRVLPDEHTWIANLAMLLHLRLRRPSGLTGPQWLAIVRDQQLEAIAHRQVDYAQLSRAVSAEAASRGGRFEWLVGASFVFERGPDPTDGELFAERLDKPDRDLVSVPRGSCALTVRHGAAYVRMELAWDPAEWPVPAERLAEEYEKTLLRLTDATAPPVGR